MLGMEGKKLICTVKNERNRGRSLSIERAATDTNARFGGRVQRIGRSSQGQLKLILRLPLMMHAVL
jgi:hypothetical protein